MNIFSIFYFEKNAFHCSKGGLTIQQWSMCLLMGSITFFVSLFAKFTPVSEGNCGIKMIKRK
jgi:hypothetical protein